MKKSITAVGLLSSAFALSACFHISSDESAPAPSSALYSTALEDGSTLDIVQADSGMILLSGSTPRGVTPLPERYDLARPVNEVYLQLFPGQPVPDVLVQAAQQEAAYWSHQPDTTAVESEDIPPPADQSGHANLTAYSDTDPGEFEANHCDPAVLSDQPADTLRHLDWCLTNWNGGFNSGTRTNVRQSYAAVAAVHGDATFRRSWRGTGEADFVVDDFYVPEGASYWAEAHSGSNDSGIDTNFQVYDADGDVFHVSALHANRVQCYSIPKGCVFQRYWFGEPEGCYMTDRVCNTGQTISSGCQGGCTGPFS